MKSSQIRVKIIEDNNEALRKLSIQTGLLQTDIAAMLLNSAVNAVREFPGRLPLVIKFQIQPEMADESNRLNETKTTKRQ